MGQYRDPKTGSWRYDFRMEHRRYTDRGYLTKRAAAVAEEERRRQISLGLTGQWATFGDLARDWLADLGQRSSDAWVKQCLWKLNKHASPIATLSLREIRPLVIQRLLAQVAKKASPKTANELRKILAACFRWAVDMGGIELNPVAKVKPIPVAPPAMKVIPVSDLRALILAADDRLARFLTIQALTGARRIEISRLRVEDVDLEHAMIALRHNKGALGRVRWVPLPGLALEAMRRQLELGSRWGWVWPGMTGQNHLSNEALDGTLREACDRAGIPRWGFHSVRRWAATRAVQAGQSDKAVAGLLGHANTRVTSRYVEVRTDSLLEITTDLERELVGVV